MSIISSERPQTLRAMTCHAPYAYALALGLKVEEYRYRATNYRGWLLFHSGVSTASDSAFQYLDITPEEAKRGFIIGAGYLNDCQQSGNYYAYQIVTPLLFQNPLRIRGKQQILWSPSDDNESKIFDSAWRIIQTMIHTAK
jgi:hypothetical protein